jgi:hypothetical protein
MPLATVLLEMPHSTRTATSPVLAERLEVLGELRPRIAVLGAEPTDGTKGR